jgi:hypothetical protein
MFSKFIRITSNLQKDEESVSDLDLFKLIPSCKKTDEFNGYIHEIIPNLYLGGCMCPCGIFRIKNRQYNNLEVYDNFEDVNNFTKTLHTIIQAGPSKHFNISEIFEWELVEKNAKEPTLIAYPKSEAPQHLFNIISKNVDKYLKDVILKIDSDLNENKKVFIHCEGGIHRSATIIAAYLMAKWKLSVEEVQKKMGFIRPGTNNRINDRESKKFLLKYKNYILNIIN